MIGRNQLHHFIELAHFGPCREQSTVPGMIGNQGFIGNLYPIIYDINIFFSRSNSFIYHLIFQMFVRDNLICYYLYFQICVSRNFFVIV